jgi:hypothetical protein
MVEGHEDVETVAPVRRNEIDNGNPIPLHALEEFLRLLNFVCRRYDDRCTTRQRNQKLPDSR